MLDTNDPLVDRGAWARVEAEPSVLAAPRATALDELTALRPEGLATRARPVVPPPPLTWLAGESAPLPRGGMLGILDGLLRVPANLMYELRERPTAHARLAVWMLGAMALTGAFVGGFAGGYQLLVVPLKLALGMSFAGLICLPSLHLFACLAGGGQSVRETVGALLSGIALTAILLVGFAPVSWVFGQATDSTVLMGTLHVTFLLISAHFGLRLTRRALTGVVGRPVAALWLWSLVFLLVVLQLSTTLRPLVGPFDGLVLADKQFFLTYWFS